MSKEIQALPDNLSPDLLAKIKEWLQTKPTSHTTDIDKLKILAERLNIQHSFKKGDIVRWKEGLANKKMPKINQFAIVIDILESPVFDPQAEAGSAYFMDKLDIVLGFITDDDSFLTYHYNSSRFEPALPE